MPTRPEDNLTELADEVAKLRAEVAGLRVELEAARPIHARVVEIAGLDVIRKALATESTRRQLAASAVEQAQKRAAAAAERAAAESVARDARLAEAERVASESKWIRLSAPKGWASMYPIPSATRSYRSIPPHGSHELSVAEWRQWQAFDSAGEIAEGIASGVLVIDPLPDGWPAMDSGQQRRNENAWRAARSAK